jgi:hypothetical protein
MGRIMSGFWRVIVAIALMSGFAANAVQGETSQTETATENHRAESMSSLYAQVRKPVTEEEFFKNVKFALDHGLLLRKDFYTKENMYRFFAAVKVANGAEHDNDHSTRFWAIAADFDGIFPRLKPDEAPVPSPDVRISTGVTVDVSGKMEGRFHLVKQRKGPTFDRIKEIFGGEFSIDRSIPHQPPPPPTGPHANEWWRYTLDTEVGKVQGFFGFNSEGFLSDFSVEEQAKKQ